MGSVVALPVTFVLGLISVKPSDFVYWCKWIVSYIHIKLNRRLTVRRFDLYDVNARNDAAKVDFITPKEEFVLESPYPESHLLDANDSVFFYGVNSKSECVTVTISRRCDQKAEAGVYLKLASGKKYQLEQTSGFQQSSSDKNVFSCGGLQLNYMTPMRTWRIFYSGYLRETDGDSTDSRMVYVKFAFIWYASSNVFDFTTDISSKFLAKALARAEWEGLYPPLSKLQGALNLYSQSGLIRGTVTIGDTQEEQEICLFGQRIRCLDDKIPGKEIDISHITGYVHKNGAFVHLAKFSAPNIVQDLLCGYVIQPDAALEYVTNVTISSSDTKPSNEAEHINASINAGFPYAFSGCVGDSMLQINSDGSKRNLSFKHLSFHLNGKKGSGVVVKGKLSEPTLKKTQETLLSESLPIIPLVVSFNEEVCQMSEATGGKGSSLGKLTHLSEDVRTFIVPKGVVLTTSAYASFVTKSILSKIKILEDVVYIEKDGDVKGACKRVSDAVIEAEIPEKVVDSLKESLKKTFGERFHTLQVAVRSSATGEDTEQMSAAGQMETFLGVSGINEILHAVKKCWASQFGYIAVQYKRQYGQCLNSPMAVVVQEMVTCDVAGVMFTCDPLTGNSSVISITANYGLGESVVSGSEEPDTIELKRDANDQLELTKISIGAKSRKIVVKEGGGHKLEDLSHEESSSCCLSTEMALRLGHLAVKIEKYYRSLRDIEWGFWNNNLYIFQSRPVTSGSSETIFEIEHEFDAPLRVENDPLSVSHTGEILPGALTPLGFQAMFKMLFILLRSNKFVGWHISNACWYFQSQFLMAYNHVMFNVVDMFKNSDPENLDRFVQATMIGFFGRLIDDKEIFEIARERYGKMKKEAKLNVLYKIARTLLLYRRIQKTTLKQYAGYRVPLEKCSTSKEVFDCLLYSCTDLLDACTSHLLCSQASLVWNMYIFTVLGNAKGGFDDDVYQDFARLITTTGGVESADVPSKIQSLVFHISRDINPEQFKNMEAEDALRWLNTSTSTAGEMFREFIEKHGHRCLMEFDIYLKPWGTNSMPLVKLLQNLSGNVSDDVIQKEDENIDDIISQLNTKLGFWSRMKLKFLIPQSRKAVQAREASKSLVVKAIDARRKGYRHLAKRMVSEGRIPEEDLLFFMTHDDIRELMEIRSPKILAKASQRMRRHPVMDSYIFPEITKGPPRPINISDTPVAPTGDNFMMKGVAVSRGTVKAFVRVAITLEEAAFLMPGEILLTYSTDIGWSPYFPTLAGVVTELGGLISHGAVVSREYGIPCIAGLHGATRQFKTGDYVFLDGNTGVLQKLPPPEDKAL